MCKPRRKLPSTDVSEITNAGAPSIIGQIDFQFDFLRGETTMKPAASIVNQHDRECPPGIKDGFIESKTLFVLLKEVIVQYRVRLILLRGGVTEVISHALDEFPIRNIGIHYIPTINPTEGSRTCSAVV
jgi:hypothetical protein